MSLIAWVKDRGGNLFLDNDGKMRLEADSVILADVWNEIVVFVRQNKQALLVELQKTTGQARWWQLGIMVLHPSPDAIGNRLMTLVQHESGRYCLQRADGVLVSISQEWAVEQEKGK